MIDIRLKKTLCCSTVLALLALRMMTPAGYMPASAGSGLLFELCPDGLPAAVINALAGSEHHHHHHGDSGDDSTSGSAIDQCPIGHMLSASMVIDDAVALQPLPPPVSFHIPSVRSLPLVSRTQYLSRGPPA